MSQIFNSLSKVPVTFTSFRSMSSVPAIQNIFQKRDFLRRIPQNNREPLLRKVNSIERKYLSSDTFTAFRLGIWDDPIFKHPEWPLMAFKAYLEDDLEEKELPKLLLYDNCKHEGLPQHGVATHTLVNPEGAEVFEKGLTGFLHDEALADLMEHLTLKLPPEAGQFFEIHQPRVKGSLLEGIQKTEFHPFLRQTEEEFIQSVIPPELLQEMLQFHFGQIARLPKPVLGFFQKEKMSLPDQRVVSLSLRHYVPLPKKLHYYPSTNLSFYHHDAIFHLLTDSSNPHRKAWIELAQFFKSKGKEDSAIRLFDGDLPSYRRTLIDPTSHSSEDLFWESLIKTELTDWHLAYRTSIDLFLEFYMMNHERWSREYGLSLESLRRFLKLHKRSEYGEEIELLIKKMRQLSL